MASFTLTETSQSERPLRMELRLYNDKICETLQTWFEVITFNAFSFSNSFKNLVSLLILQVTNYNKCRHHVEF